MCDVQAKYIVEKDGKNWFVQMGYCDKRPTKWITTTPWTDFIICLQVVDGELTYSDSKGAPMLVYEDDDDEWNDF
jgi:hypothetical protein